MTCIELGEFFRVAALTCTDLGEFIKVVASATTATAAAIGAYLALTKAEKIIVQRQADLDLRREELNYLKGRPPTS